MYPLHGMVFDCLYCDPLSIGITLSFVLIIWGVFILIYTVIVFSKKAANEIEKKNKLRKYLVMIISIITIVGGTYSFILIKAFQKSKIQNSIRKKELKIEQQQIKLKIDSLQNYINESPDSAQLYYDLALELRHLGLWKYEVQVLKKGILVDSTNSDCHLGLANIYGHYYSNLDAAIRENKLGLKHMRTNPQWVIEEIAWLEELKKKKKKKKIN